MTSSLPSALRRPPPPAERRRALAVLSAWAAAGALPGGALLGCAGTTGTTGTTGASGPGAAPAATADDPALRAAVDDPRRTPAWRARDGARHPYETLRFFGVAPAQTVLELSPGAGWYTEILAPYLRERGQLWVAHAPRDGGDEASRRARAAYEARLATDPARYDRVRVGTLPDGPVFEDLGPPASVDRVLSFRNVHNWLEEGRLDALLRASHALLKPGGVLGLVDHRARPGTPVEQQMATGYTTEALIRARAEAAGFRFDGRSDVNANPRDTKDHPQGVWSLPPTLRGGDVDRERYLAIGESDRYTHRYVKTASA